MTQEPIDELRESVRRRAYELYEQRNGEGGSADDDWLRAEREVRRDRVPPQRTDVEGAIIRDNFDGAIVSSGDADVTGIAPTFTKPKARGGAASA